MLRPSKSSRIHNERRKREARPTIDFVLCPPSSPSTFAAALSQVAIAQICLSSGYSAAEPSALRALSDIATRYVQALGRSAVSVAAAHCRTDCNILDLARAIEDVNEGLGFAGAADAAGPPMRSGALKELMAFVETVEEVPFPQRILWGEGPEARKEGWRSFAVAGREPPSRHVPSWLPCFPEGSWGRESKGKEINWEREGEERMGAAAELGEPAERGSARRPCEDVYLIRPLGGFPMERERVRFRLNPAKRRRHG